MRLRWLVFTLPLFLIACVAAPNLIDLRSTTVKVANMFGHGSGTVISPKYILTAAHVVKPDESLMVEFSDGRLAPAKVFWRDAVTDMALLELEKPEKNFSPIDCAPLELGERIFTFGNPEFLRFVLTEGIVADNGPIGAQIAMMPEGMPEDVKPMVLVSANWEPGDSGAGVFDKNGRIRGIVSIVFNTSRGGISNNALITPVTVLPECQAK